MSREAVGLVLQAMADDTVRSRIEAGDLTKVPGSDELTAEETELVVAAAGDYPDTGGFDMGSISGASTGAYNPSGAVNTTGVTSGGNLGPGVGSNFGGSTNGNPGGGTSTGTSSTPIGGGPFGHAVHYSLGIKF